MKKFIVIWKYKVKEDMISEFEKLYGKDGEWISLFKKSSDYIGTEIYKGINNIYITIDYWKSKETYNNFKNSFKINYFEIDKKGEGLTYEEENICEYSAL
jgi:heme-degrading monooxygenase HmoA